MRTSLAPFALAATLAALLSSTAVSARTVATPDPIYVASSQYTAVLDQSTQHWQLRPAEGAILDIRASACGAHAQIPNGLWLLVSDAHGKAELVAPSATVLPAGMPDRIALRDCDANGEGPALAVPQSLIDLLTSNTGAIYVRQ